MKNKGKIIVGIFVFCLLIFMLPGLMTGPIKIKTVTHIKQPLSKVFITFGDPASLPEWMKGFEKIEHIYGIPFSEGSKYRLTFVQGHKKIVTTEEIIKVDWKKHLILDMNTSRVKLTADLYFFQFDNFTEINGTFTLSGHDFITKVLLPWIKPRIRKKLDIGLDRYRAMMEKDQRR